MKYIEKSDGFFVNELGEMFRHGKLLTPHSGGAGGKYYKQRIYNLDGSVYRKNIHRFVAEAFIPNPENLPHVNHKNGNKRDNRVENLEWCTPAYNIKHARETGLNNNYHENHHSAVLTNSQVHDICKKMQDGWRNCEIAKEFGIKKHIPASIRAGITWVEISSKYDVNRQRAKRTSEDTIHWICRQMENGLSNSEIKKAATSEAVTANLICDIRSRRRWNIISDKYKF